MSNYLTVRNWPLRYGGFFTDRDISSAAKACVIGQTLVGERFQTTDPLGQTIRIANIPFRVIGVLEPKGVNMFGQEQDNIVLLINAMSSGTDWPVVISVPAGVVAFLFAAAVGIFFGYYPVRSNRLRFATGSSTFLA